MALVIKDRVKETSTTTGTGTLTLLGAETGFDAFSEIGNANTTYYCIQHQSADEWEVGIGTYTASGTTLSRDTVLASSNGGAAVDFSAGTKDVFVTVPARRLPLSAVLSRSSNTILGVPDYAKTLIATSTYTQTLTAAATLGDGWFIDIIVDSGATLTLDPNSTETVDGSATKAIVGPAQGRLVCNGTLFRTIGFNAAITETAWTDYSATSTVVGWSSFSTKQIYYKKMGRTVFVQFSLVGTSNATTVTFTLPFTSSNTVGSSTAIRARDNTGTPVGGVAVIPANSATVECWRDIALSAWTNSGNKYVIGTLTYEANS